MVQFNFSNLVLLIGTNPLPNFVIADYFLKSNQQLKTIWLLHSEENNFQAGTVSQAKNLEALLRTYWYKKHNNLNFPLEKVALSEVSSAEAIQREINQKMISRWKNGSSFHLNYTGGTKAMAVHIYNWLKELANDEQYQFSYLDANNYRLVADNHGVIEEDLRKSVKMEFADLIALHGFKRKNKDSDDTDFEIATVAYQNYISNIETMTPQDGKLFEVYLKKKLSDNFNKILDNKHGVLHNWEIQKYDWRTYFELDLILLNGYHLTGISCTLSHEKKSCKTRGFEIILRTRQIGGDEARAILITRTNRNQTQLLQEELVYETGGSNENILVLGIDDLKNEKIYLPKIKKFVFD